MHGMETVMLPGADLVEQGLIDLAGGRETAASLLVSIGASRLRAFGLEVPRPFPDAELRLYDMLRETHGDGAHSQFNALVRRLVSYVRARCVT
jgi:hypothetical protein